MMNPKIDKMSAAMGGIDTAYLEEALNYVPKANSGVFHWKKAARFPKLSAACVALLLAFGLSATAIAVSRMPLSWRDIFRPNQTVIGDEDESPVVSQLVTNVEDIQIDVVKAISDERVLYLLYSMKANDGAVLSPNGRFASFDMYFPGKMMSGAYQQYLLERKDGVPENELEGVIYADWQADGNAKNLVLHFADWQEKKQFDDAKVDFSVADMVAAAGKNAELPILYIGHDPQYLWQPGNAEIALPYGGISICNAGWEDGLLQIVMKGPKGAGEWATGQNWYFIDTRTDTAIYPEQSAYFHAPDEFDSSLADADWCYFWNFVSVEKEVLPYLEMHWGGVESFETVLPGEWEVNIDETPVTVQSKLLAEDVALSYSGTELLAEKIECSKLSLAVYFADYVDPTTGVLSAFKVFDANGNPIQYDWGFTADPTGNSCMIWTRFEEPIDLESVGKITFNGDVVFKK